MRKIRKYRGKEKKQKKKRKKEEAKNEDTVSQVLAHCGPQTRSSPLPVCVQYQPRMDFTFLNGWKKIKRRTIF